MDSKLFQSSLNLDSELFQYEIHVQREISHEIPHDIPHEFPYERQHKSGILILSKVENFLSPSTTAEEYNEVSLTDRDIRQLDQNQLDIEKTFDDLADRVKRDRNSGENIFVLIAKKDSARFTISNPGRIYTQEGLAKLKPLEKPIDDDPQPNQKEHGVIGFHRNENVESYFQEHLYDCVCRFLLVNSGKISPLAKKICVIPLHFFNSLTANSIQLKQYRYYSGVYAVTLLSISMELYGARKYDELNNLLAQMLELIKKPENLKRKLDQIIEYVNKVKINADVTFHNEMYEHIENACRYDYHKLKCDGFDDYVKTASELARERRDKMGGFAYLCHMLK